jgi:L-ascorbate metabolism protein UlaG (beta-lactamase superfamily)
VTAHFNGARFLNPQPIDEKHFADLLKWVIHRERGKWNRWTESPYGPKPPGRVGAGALRATFVNHSTILIQLDGLNILTDPVWSERASPLSWLGPRRHRPPGLRLEDLPALDVILVSHNHYDHMDLETLAKLARVHHPRVFTTLGNRRFLESKGIPTTAELDWWQDAPLTSDVGLHCVPAQHFSGRGMCDRNTSMWAGFVLTAESGNVYFAADSGMGPHFAEIGRRLGPFRLAFLPIGAYRPKWFMAPVHMAPDEAVITHSIVRSAISVPIHYGTFALGDDGETEPLEDLERALAAASPRPEFWVLEHGEGRDVPPLTAAS